MSTNFCLLALCRKEKTTSLGMFQEKFMTNPSSPFSPVYTLPHLHFHTSYSCKSFSALLISIGAAVKQLHGGVSLSSAFPLGTALAHDE